MAKTPKTDEEQAAADKAAADKAAADKAGQPRRPARAIRPAERFTVRAPLPFTGKRCEDRLSFRDGAAVTDSPADAAFCRGLGYAVTDHGDDAE